MGSNLVSFIGYCPSTRIAFYGFSNDLFSTPKGGHFK